MAPESQPQPVVEVSHSATTSAPVAAAANTVVAPSEPVAAVVVPSSAVPPLKPVATTVDVAEPTLVVSPQEPAAPAKVDAFKAAEPLALSSPAADLVTGSTVAADKPELIPVAPAVQVNLKTTDSVEENLFIPQKPVVTASVRIPLHLTQAEDDHNELAHLQRTGAGEGKMTSAKVDVTFTNSSSLGDDSSSTGNDKSGTQGREKNRENVQAFALSSPHSPEMRESVPVAAPAREDEMKNSLRDSILSQVKHADLRHDVKGNGLISIRLSPEELGDLTINVRVEEHRLKVEVITENQTVRSALMSNMESLKETLLKQNFTMERFDVSTGAGSHGSNQAFREEPGAQRDDVPRQFARSVELADVPMTKRGEADEERESSLVDLIL